jgi:DNA-binding IclR family transcriptional regulator
LRGLLYAASQTKPEERRLSGKVSRFLRLLRAHGVVRKIPKTHRYQLTERGRLLTAALRATRDASIQQLLRSAAEPVNDFETAAVRIY